MSFEVLHKDFTTTLVIADVFKMSHLLVLDYVEESICDREFSLNNFLLKEQISSSGEKVYYYEMTKSGMMLICADFAGEIADRWRADLLQRGQDLDKFLAYIDSRM